MPDGIWQITIPFFPPESYSSCLPRGPSQGQVQLAHRRDQSTMRSWIDLPSFLFHSLQFSNFCFLLTGPQINYLPRKSLSQALLLGWNQVKTFVLKDTTLLCFHPISQLLQLISLANVLFSSPPNAGMPQGSVLGPPFPLWSHFISRLYASSTHL